jgi:hypothetical protein
VHSLASTPATWKGCQHLKQVYQTSITPAISGVPKWQAVVVSASIVGGSSRVRRQATLSVDLRSLTSCGCQAVLDACIDSGQRTGGSVAQISREARPAESATGLLALACGFSTGGVFVRSRHTCRRSCRNDRAAKQEAGGKRHACRWPTFTKATSMALRVDQLRRNEALALAPRDATRGAFRWQTLCDAREAAAKLTMRGARDRVEFVGGFDYAACR